jgi:hypothetical protein
VRELRLASQLLPSTHSPPSFRWPAGESQPNHATVALIAGTATAPVDNPARTTSEPAAFRSIQSPKAAFRRAAVRSRASL